MEEQITPSVDQLSRFESSDLLMPKTEEITIENGVEKKVFIRKNLRMLSLNLIKSHKGGQSS